MNPPVATTAQVDAAWLRGAGRAPATPFSVVLADGDTVTVTRLLRVLAGKRVVGAGVWQGRRVLAKLFVASGSARHWTQERTGIEALLRAKIPTPELLLAQALPSGGHALLTAFVDDAQNLVDAQELASFDRMPDRGALSALRSAFEVLGRMHAVGLIQEDLHLGNFIRQGKNIFVIDGDAVRAISAGVPLPARAAASNLAILLAQLPPAWSAFRKELIGAYLSGGGCSELESSWLEREIQRVRAWRLADFLRKTVRNCTLFSVRRAMWKFTAVVRREESFLAPLLESLDAAIAGGKCLKDGNTCTVAQIEAGQEILVVKRYNLKSWMHALGRCWRPSRAWHSWREGHRLAFLGIPTPTPLALLEERLGLLRGRAFLVNTYCPGIDLAHLLSPEEVPPSAIAEAIAGLFQALCAQRISHGDLKATNLLWHDSKVFVIDLDAVVQHGSARSFRAAWQRDRARLLRNWPADSALYQWLERSLPPA